MTHVKLSGTDIATIRQALRTAIAAQQYLHNRLDLEPKSIATPLMRVVSGDIAVYEALLKRMQAL